MDHESSPSISDSRPKPDDRLTEDELKRLRRLIASARELRKRLRRFADGLPEQTGKHPESERMIARSRLDCILYDRIDYALDDLQDILVQAEKEPAP
jgi:hypothetical protein